MHKEADRITAGVADFEEKIAILKNAIHRSELKNPATAAAWRLKLGRIESDKNYLCVLLIRLKNKLNKQTNENEKG